MRQYVQSRSHVNRLKVICPTSSYPTSAMLPISFLNCRSGQSSGHYTSLTIMFSDTVISGCITRLFRLCFANGFGFAIVDTLNKVALMSCVTSDLYGTIHESPPGVGTAQVGANPGALGAINQRGSG